MTAACSLLVLLIWKSKYVHTYPYVPLGSEISCRAVPIVITSTSLLLTNCTLLVILHVNTYDLATIYHRVNRINEYYLSKSTYHIYKLGVDMIHVHHILLFPREELSITACFSRRARVPQDVYIIPIFCLPMPPKTFQCQLSFLNE